MAGRGAIILVAAAASCTQRTGRGAPPTLSSLHAFTQFRAHLGAGGALVLTSKGLRRADARLPAYLPARADAPLRIEDAAAPDVFVEIVDTSAPPLTPETEGAAAVFADVARDTDVVYVAEATRVEELRLLRSPRAPTTTTYALRIGPGVSELRLRAGCIEVVDARARSA